MDTAFTLATPTIRTDRLAALDSLTLASGAHNPADAGQEMCVMEAAAWVAGEPHTDHPECVSPVLGAFLRRLNDTWGDEQRQTLKPFAARVIGTAGDGQDDARSYLALDWLIRTYAPAWLDLAGLTAEAQELRVLRRIVDLIAAKDAGPVVRNARTKAAAAGDAAWDAAGDAARAAAWAAAGTAARAAAGAAAWDAAWAAAGAAAGADAWAAAGDAARAAAGAALAPTVATLQASALQLIAAMIDPTRPLPTREG